MENTNPERSFIYKLYLDGATDHFSTGPEIDELNRLIYILLTDWEDPKLLKMTQ